MNDARKRIEDDFEPTLPADDIICKECEYRKRDLKDENGNVIVKGYKNGYCEVYKPMLGGKPNEILFNNARCKYFRKED